MKKTLLLMMCCLTIQLGLAQQKSITGRVTNASDGLPVAAATVRVMNSSVATQTNGEGEFNLMVDVGANLAISAVGFVTYTQNVGSQNHYNVSLVPDDQEIEQVIIVGYGAQSKRTVTSSIASVSADDIKNIPSPSPDQLMQGRAAGVIVSAGSGEPGAGNMVRVRGSTSINASSDPLYVIDGIPIVSQNLAQQTFGQPSNPLADINPADIESMQILKDASATAIYGARAANGVILITTKRGKSGKPTVSFSTYAGISTLWKSPNELRIDGPTHEKLQNEAAANNWIDSYGSITALNPSGRGFTPPYANPESALNTNWFDGIFSNGNLKNIDASVSGGNDRTTYMVSANYFSQLGNVKPTQFDRGSARLNLDFNVSDAVKIGTSVFYSNNVRNRLQNGNNVASAVANAFFYASNEPIYREDGSYNKPVFENPIAIVEETDYRMNTDRILGNLYADWKILDNLIFKTSWSIDNNYVSEQRYENTKLNAGAATNGSAMSSIIQDFNWINENILTFNFDIASAHNFDMLAGTTYQSSKNSFVRAEGSQFPGDNFRKISSAAVLSSRATETGWAIASLFGRVNYNYKQKYLFTGNLRYDGSSRFGVNNRWGLFPSASVGWVMSDENFMQDIAFISQFKWRASYGVTGNQSGIDNFASLGLWGGQRGGVSAGGGTTPINTTSMAASYAGYPGFNPVRLANPDLKWETTAQFNVGVDLSFYRNRLNVTFDYYDKQTRDLLLDVPVPMSTGYNSLTQNFGEMSNKGFELGITAIPYDRENFRWEATFNISQNKNLVKKIAAPFNQFTRDYIRVEEGYPLFTFWVHEQLGVDPQTGDVIWNTGDDDEFDPNVDRFMFKNAWPDYVGGLTNTFNVGDFDLMAFFQYSVGNSIFNYNRYFFEHGGERTTGYTGQQLDRWQEPGDITDIPRMARVNYNVNYRPSRHVEDGSYLRLKNVSLGYTFPRSIITPLGLTNLRLYVSGQNVLTFTKYSGLDPEVSTSPGELVQGIDYGVMPQPRIWMGGINVTF